MPLFFVVAGLFVGRSVRKPARVFFADKGGSILWPYVVWSLIHGVLTILLARATGGTTRLTLVHLPRDIALDPIAQFWFLYVLFMALACYWLLVRAGLAAWAILLVGVAMLMMRTNINWNRVGLSFGDVRVSLGQWGPWFQLLNYFLYMALGAVAAGWLLSNMQRMRTWQAAIAGVAAAVAWGDPQWVRRDGAWSFGGWHIPVGVGLALVSVAGGLCVALLAERSGVLGVIRTCGQQSLAIFVMHVIFAAAIRSAMLKLGIRNFAVHLVVGVAVGTALPIIAAALAHRAGLGLLFRLRPSPAASPPPDGPDVPRLPTTLTPQP